MQIVVGLLRRCSLLGWIKTRHKRGLFLPWKYASNRHGCLSPSRAVVGLFSFLSGAAVCIQLAAAPVVFRNALRVEFQTMLFCFYVFVHALAWRNCAAGGIFRCRKHGGIMRCSQIFGGLNLFKFVLYPIG